MGSHYAIESCLVNDGAFKYGRWVPAPGILFFFANVPLNSTSPEPTPTPFLHCTPTLPHRALSSRSCWAKSCLSPPYNRWPPSGFWKALWMGSRRPHEPQLLRPQLPAVPPDQAGVPLPEPPILNPQCISPHSGGPPAPPPWCRSRGRGTTWVLRLWKAREI